MPESEQARLLIGSAPIDLKERLKRRREWIVTASLSLLFVGLTVLEFRLTQVAKSLPFVTSIFFFGLLNINLIILIALVWLVARNIGKIFLERRRNLLGSRLKTKLVIAFLGFSIIPTVVLFLISALYINSSFDKWFSLKIQNTLQASLEITNTYYRNTDQTAMHFARHLAKGLSARLLRGGARDGDWQSRSEPFRPAWLSQYLSDQRELLALDAVEFYGSPLDERVLARMSAQVGGAPPVAYPRLSLDLLDRAFLGETFSVIQHIGSGDLIRCLVPVTMGQAPSAPLLGVVVVSSYIPVSLVTKVDEIASVFGDYKDSNPLKYPMKRSYLVILVLITLVILFVAIWIGFYLARELTVPVERLVHGAQAVGAGNLDVTVLGTGKDEIAVLVESFNKMTQDLRENRARLVEAGADLEKRRLQLEAVLTHIAAGVVAVDRRGVITTFNPALGGLLGLVPEACVGRDLAEVLASQAPLLVQTIQEALTDVPSAPPVQWHMPTGDGIRTLQALVTPLRLEMRLGSTPWGAVAVIDDMSHLIKGQREMAWREVARRIAHEIKNPLTPIKLSAQRLQRRMSSYRGKDGALLKECTDTIIKNTDDLKQMVNEFSNFARFPEVNPQANNLNEAVTEVLSLFQQAHPGIDFRVQLEPRVPVFEFDREQINRVLMNLLDNAVAALAGFPPGPGRRIGLATHYNEGLQIAALEVADNGPGMIEEVRNRVFEPYFSTKEGGTGLGLAIAKRIVNDHDGFIRVHSSPGEGTRFLIELPTTPRHLLERAPGRLEIASNDGAWQ